MSDLYKLPQNFPTDLFEKGTSLIGIGINEIGWRYDDIRRVIEFMTHERYAILGGDIYIVEDQNIEYTFDSWYLNRENKIWDEYIKESKDKCIEYIQNYNDKNVMKQKNFLYVIVYSLES